MSVNVNALSNGGSKFILWQIIGNNKMEYNDLERECRRIAKLIDN